VGVEGAALAIGQVAQRVKSLLFTKRIFLETKIRFSGESIEVREK
jgi:hypothetical protein